MLGGGGVAVAAGAGDAAVGCVSGVGNLSTFGSRSWSSAATCSATGATSCRQTGSVSASSCVSGASRRQLPRWLWWKSQVAG
jgi:hypothetical protein